MFFSRQLRGFCLERIIEHYFCVILHFNSNKRVENLLFYDYFLNLRETFPQNISPNIRNQKKRFYENNILYIFYRLISIHFSKFKCSKLSE